MSLSPESGISSVGGSVVVEMSMGWCVWGHGEGEVPQEFVLGAGGEGRARRGYTDSE